MEACKSVFDKIDSASISSIILYHRHDRKLLLIIRHLLKIVNDHIQEAIEFNLLRTARGPSDVHVRMKASTQRPNKTLTPTNFNPENS